MAKLKSQKEKDLAELTDKLKTAKAVVFTGYRGTTVKDMDTFRSSLRKENVFSKVYKIPLMKKALEALGIDAAAVDYKQPVILSLSQEDETVTARIIKNLTKEFKTFCNFGESFGTAKSPARPKWKLWATCQAKTSCARSLCLCLTAQFRLLPGY